MDRTFIALVVLGAAAWFLVAPTVQAEQSPAPGCGSDGFLSPIGGCHGVRVVRDIAVTPEISCLDVRTNNCNGGVVVVDNGCGTPVTLGNVTVPPDDRETVEISGNGTVLRTSGNFAGYSPDATRRLSAAGIAGEQTFTLAYTKTGPLC